LVEQMRVLNSLLDEVELFAQLLVLLVEAHLVSLREPPHLHSENVICLHLIELELTHELRLSYLSIVRVANDADGLVKIDTHRKQRLDLQHAVALDVQRVVQLRRNERTSALEELLDL